MSRPGTADISMTSEAHESQDEVDESLVHPVVLAMIYDYLKWIGSWEACALLLHEPPFKFDPAQATTESKDGTRTRMPELYTYVYDKLGIGRKNGFVCDTEGKGGNKLLDESGRTGNGSLNASVVDPGAALSQLSSPPAPTSTVNRDDRNNVSPISWLSNHSNASLAEWADTCAQDEEETKSPYVGVEVKLEENVSACKPTAEETTRNLHKAYNLKDLSIVLTRLSPDILAQYPAYEESKSNFSEGPRTSRKGKESFKCSSCSLHFPKKRLCARHFRQVHLGQKYHSCHICGHKSARKFDLEKHMKTHVKTKPPRKVKKLPVSLGKPWEVEIGPSLPAVLSIPEKAKINSPAADGSVLDVIPETGSAPKAPEIQLSKPSNSSNTPRLLLQAGADTEERSRSSTIYFKCRLCDLRFANRRLCTRHFRQVHLGQKYHDCHICGHKSARKFDLVKHMQTHVDKKPRKRRARKPPGEKESRSSFPASLQEAGVNPSALEEELSGSDETPFKCQSCDLRFAKRRLYSRHVRQVHLGQKYHDCPICGHKSARKFDLLKHMNIHVKEEQNNSSSQTTPPNPLRVIKGVEEASKRELSADDKELLTKAFLPSNPIYCEVAGCPRIHSFKDKADLEIHRNKCHQGILQPYECQVCGRRFRERQYLKRHHTVVHLGQRTISCSRCHFRSSLPHEIKRHSLIHSQERPYSCDECPATFKVQTHLQVHKISKHTEERPFCCDRCGKGFVTNVRLQTHIRAIHNRQVRPYICELCGKTFPVPGYLYMHKRHSHPSSTSSSNKASNEVERAQ